jgi:hypothetical protein
VQKRSPAGLLEISPELSEAKLGVLGTDDGAPRQGCEDNLDSCAFEEGYGVYTLGFYILRIHPKPSLLNLATTFEELIKGQPRADSKYRPPDGCEK